MIRIILILAASLPIIAQTRLPLRQGVCVPTSQQIANRTSTTSFPNAQAPETPRREGDWYCDPIYGTTVVRLDDNSSVNSTVQTQTLGQLAFSRDRNYAGWICQGGTICFTTINITTDNLASRTAVAPTTQLDVVKDAALGTVVGLNGDMWFDMAVPGDSTTPHRLFIKDNYAARIYAIDLRNPKATTGPAAGGFPAVLVADLRPTVGASFPTLNRSQPAEDGRTVSHTLTHTGNGIYGYIVITINDVSGASPTTSFTVNKMFRNGIDTGGLTACQTFAGTTWQACIFNAATSGGNPWGYKPSGVIKSGGAIWLLHAAGDAAAGNPCPGDGACQGGGGPYLTPVAENLATGDLKFLHGGGHSDAGNLRVFAINTSQNGNCKNQPKYWDFADVPNNTPAASGGTLGTCLLPTGNWPWVAQYTQFVSGAEYISAFSKTNTFTLLRACPDGPCSTAAAPGGGVFSMWPSLDELININTASNTFTRIARIWHTKGAGLDFLQPIQSRDGRLIQFASNWKADLPLRQHVYAVLVP